MDMGLELNLDFQVQIEPELQRVFAPAITRRFLNHLLPPLNLFLVVELLAIAILAVVLGSPAAAAAPYTLLVGPRLFLFLLHPPRAKLLAILRRRWLRRSRAVLVVLLVRLCERRMFFFGIVSVLDVPIIVSPSALLFALLSISSAIPILGVSVVLGLIFFLWMNSVVLALEVFSVDAAILLIIFCGCLVRGLLRCELLASMSRGLVLVRYPSLSAASMDLTDDIVADLQLLRQCFTQRSTRAVLR